MLVFSLLILSYFFLFIFSYLWVDFNLSLTHYPFLVNFLDKFQHWGYFNRSLSAKIYLGLLLLLFSIQLYLFFSGFLKKQSLKKLLVLAGAVTLIASLSYPFLSADIFHYLFDAKIIGYYHQNPYLYSPNSFPGDSWLRFTHWVHLPTPYGPTWLLYSLIPFAFSLGKFILNFYGLKLLNGLLFLSAGIFLLRINKNDKNVFAYWFFNPFLIIELLVNSHNDILVIFLFYLSLFLLLKKMQGKFFVFIASVLIKFVHIIFASVLFLKKKYRRLFFNFLVVFLFFYFAYLLNASGQQFHSWYFSWLFMALPFIGLNNFSWFLIFILEAVILIFKYCPFILTGSWQETSFLTFFRALFIFYGLVFFLPVLQLRLWRSLKSFGKKV